MSNLQIKTMLVMFQISLLIIQALTYTYISRAKELKAGKLNRLTSISIVITAVTFFISGIVIAL